MSTPLDKNRLLTIPVTREWSSFILLHKGGVADRLTAEYAIRVSANPLELTEDPLYEQEGDRLTKRFKGHITYLLGHLLLVTEEDVLEAVTREKVKENHICVSGQFFSETDFAARVTRKGDKLSVKLDGLKLLVFNVYRKGLLTETIAAEYNDSEVQVAFGADGQNVTLRKKSTPAGTAGWTDMLKVMLPHPYDRDVSVTVLSR